MPNRVSQGKDIISHESCIELVERAAHVKGQREDGKDKR